VVGVTNPKALILLGSTPPQFVNRATADEALQMHLLSLVSGTGLRSSLAISGCAPMRSPAATAFAPSIGPEVVVSLRFCGVVQVRIGVRPE
jgi:threonine/homoserine/homoserine lactone efflux protein